MLPVLINKITKGAEKCKDSEEAITEHFEFDVYDSFYE